jgi:hypothetical protein
VTVEGVTSMPDTVRRFVRFLETGEADGLFAEDVSSELNLPFVQMHETSAAAIVALRRREHPGLTEVCVERLDRTERGWVLQLEERWIRGGARWYSRELFRLDIEDDRVVGFVVYCTGDWDETLQRERAATAGAGGP